MKPLNGEKTHPLSEHAKAELANMQSGGPVPRVAVNPGVANRLLREALVEEAMLPSPFKTHNGRPIAHLRITAAGRAALQPSQAAPQPTRRCGHPLGSTRWCPDCELADRSKTPNARLSG